MDTPNPLKDSDHLLDDLESIRKLLGDDDLQPPLLTDAVNGDVQIPLLFDMVGGKPVTPEPFETPAVQAAPAAAVAVPAAEKAPDALLLHLDNELRAAAQLIMQDVIDDFAPHIETEIKRRLDARMERLLSQYQN
ncbi:MULTISPECIES: DNA polymerase III subunit chi [unclassified Pseudomonas]|uniref:DNA polymerase III subunit chi n=1 Tax=unclassified Pseudomonas TaxID=196821 RepID=UPI000C869D87|nr:MULTISPECIES: DNA polymerase III subunit chi [unclassified Pseudomonas]PMU23462.1 DNA polymerase III subunit chi [Pseudomonas sp. GP01-A9]PMU27123.1 DNA polymerase III subunit chi [Pseudomonas sp. GP01-A13]PMU38015.1 DNA polymerase III subunit chi [Pseudomonas sp. GP01-A8]PMU47261.1 DNA polymerase III subunit chi [Pseudomonas sp. GP01-A14]PMU51517.1 DNA polymerase III subunit chi [Pseudomonas sp. GP01-A6]